MNSHEFCNVYVLIPLKGDLTMKKYLTILLCIYSLLTAADHSLVFVHIGKTLPSYIDIALEQAKLFNDKCDIYFIASKAALHDFDIKGITTIPYENLKKSPQHKNFEKVSKHNTSFRNGFWRFATERFFYIDELVKKLNLKNVIHIESDNMVYVDFEELLPFFEKNYPGIGAVFAADNRCIPSIVYFSNKRATSDLADYLSKTADKGLNDMYGIANYRINRREKYIDFLPTVPSEYVESCAMNPLRGPKTKKKESYCNHFDEIISVFDTQAIGQYLGGQDHRNHGNSFPGQINRLTNYIASDFNFEWILDNQQRAIPYMIFKGRKYRINNIHVHSKDLEDFYSLDKKPEEVNICIPQSKYLYVL